MSRIPVGQELLTFELFDSESDLSKTPFLGLFFRLKFTLVAIENITRDRTFPD